MCLSMCTHNDIRGVLLDRAIKKTCVTVTSLGDGGQRFCILPARERIIVGDGDHATLSSFQLNMLIENGSSHDNGKAAVSNIIILISDVI